MARRATQLMDMDIKNAKPKAKGYSLYDCEGLILYVTKKGTKSFRLKYKFEGKENTLALGIFPELTLAKARAKKLELRRLIAEGIDPAKERQEVKAEI
jgi:hypothetical protein